MCDRNEEKEATFTCVKDRLKKFEQNKEINVKPSSNAMGSESFKANQRQTTSTIHALKSNSNSVVNSPLRVVDKANLGNQWTPRNNLPQPKNIFEAPKPKVVMGSSAPPPPVRVTPVSVKSKGVIPEAPLPPPPELYVPLTVNPPTTNQKSNPNPENTFFPPPPQMYEDTSPKHIEVPPRLPPPPSTIKKSNLNSLTGWVKHVGTKPGTISGVPINIVTETRVEKVINEGETNKPPPIKAAPPSVTEVTQMKNLKKESKPSFPEDDTYDDDVPPEKVLPKELEEKPWFFDISKTKSTELMKMANTDIGTFMVRPSEDDQYVLMVRVQDDLVKKFKIQKLPTGWMLGDPTKCKKTYQTISNLLDFYIENGIKVGTTLIKLKEPPKQ